MARALLWMVEWACGQASVLWGKHMYTEKESVRAVIYTPAVRIIGDVHILSGSRLTDALNSKAKDFLAVTDAQLMKLQEDEALHKASYVAVNRDEIICIFPLEEAE